jgi:hypothetical protein
MKKLLIFSVLLSGCSLFQQNVAPQLAQTVDKYCEQLSYPVRVEMRKTVNSMVKPGTTVVVTCPGDPKQ